MDENERARLRASIRFADVCEGIVRTEDELDRAVEGVIELENTPGHPNSRDAIELHLKAKARSEKEGIPICEALEEEVTKSHEAYWAEQVKKGVLSKDEI